MVLIYLIFYTLQIFCCILNAAPAECGCGCEGDSNTGTVGKGVRTASSGADVDGNSDVDSTR